MIIAYQRVSSLGQTMSQQRKAIEEYAVAHNLVIDRFISDEGISAYSKSFDARDGLLEVLEYVERGNVTDLIIFETSRISRRYGESVGLFDKLTMKGVKIHSVVDNGVINAQEIDSLMLAFRSYMNQQSSKLTSERIKSKLSLMKSQGLYCGGKVTWGFKVVENRVTVDEDLKPTIINFFNDYITYGAKYVMEKYDMNSKAVVNKRIKNKDYIQIIGAELFNQANKVREDRRMRKNYTSKTNRTPQLFEGLLIHNCGKKLYMSYQSNGKYYRCYNCCKDNKKTFRVDTLEKAIESEVASIFDTLSYEKLREQAVLQIEKLSLVLDLEVKSINTEIEKVEKSISTAKKRLNKFILEDDADIIIKQISELIEDKTKELDELKLQLVTLRDKQDSIDSKIEIQMHKIESLLDAKNIYSNASLEHKKSILQLIIKNIEVIDYNNVNIFLNI